MGLSKPTPESLGAPPGTIVNLVDPVNQDTSFIILHSICLAIITIGLAMRLYTRKFIVKHLKLDDYLCVCAYFLAIAGDGVTFWATLEGNGRHIWDLDWKGGQLKRIFRPFNFGIWIYIVTVAVIKLAFLSFYRNLFLSSRKTLLFVNGGIIAVVILYIIMLFTQIFQCVPAARSWDMSIQGYCTKVHFVSYYSGFVNTFSDIYVLMVPIPAVWALPLVPAQKLRVISVFALGLIATTMSIVRLAMFFKLLKGSKDTTWELAKIDAWSTLEVHCGLLCACLLVFPAFVKRHWPKRLTFFFSKIFHTNNHDEESFVTASGMSVSRKDFSHSEWSQMNRSDEVNLTRVSSNSDELPPPVRFNTTRHLDAPEEPHVDFSTLPPLLNPVSRPPIALFGGNQGDEPQEMTHSTSGGPMGGGMHTSGGGPMGGGPMGGM